MEELKICKRCVLPDRKPNIILNEEGICNICTEHDRTKHEGENNKFLETEFNKILSMYKSYGQYDCLVMCSGGKDSTAALYYMKKRYKLNPLAFTFDHGFETEDALKNIKNAIEILGVDFLYFKTDYMDDMFLEIIKTDARAVICHLCSIWYMNLTFEIAAQYNIPMIIGGWTKGQSSKQPLMSRCGCNIHQAEFISMAKATGEFLSDYRNKNSKYKDFPGTMEEVLIRAKRRQRCIVVSPHWFLPFGPEVYIDIIKRELNWEFPKVSYPAKTTNCYLNFISVYNSLKYFGYTHYHVEMSKMIREGFLSRDEALGALCFNYDRKFLNEIATKLGCSLNGA